MDFPYKAEYAKSGRASCRSCKSTIAKDTLRLAVMVQSPMFDGKTPQWYHFPCFFKKQRPKSSDDIEHFENLRWEDQESIKSKITSGTDVILPDKKGKKRPGEAAAKKLALKDFIVEYSKSSRALCRGCQQKIIKDEIRISKKDFESDVGKRYGGQDMWHHLSCFSKLRSELGFYESGSALPGFKSLSTKDQEATLKELPAIKQEEVEAKKMKTEDQTDAPVDNEIEKKLKAQNKMMFKHRDNLTELSKKELQELLEVNNQEVPPGVDESVETNLDGDGEDPQSEIEFQQVAVVTDSSPQAGPSTEQPRSSAQQVKHFSELQSPNAAHVVSEATSKSSSFHNSETSIKIPPPSREHIIQKKLAEILMSAIDKLDKISEGATVNKDDNFDHFGKYLASLLRTLPIEQSLRLQQEIITRTLNAHILGSISSPSPSDDQSPADHAFSPKREDTRH
ncbi:hypothetical protein RI129_008284 [Pyrocoelia pectoralis]|uniref:PARP-type domain-containing protein n=1 Tax=Pyrocoelia pectoralis TaxID=417401 RepID=A0AAN7V737_9COLE